MEKEKFKKELLIYGILVVLVVVIYGGYLYFFNKNLEPEEQAPLVTEEIIEKNNNEGGKNLSVDNFTASFSEGEVPQEVLDQFTAPEAESLPPSKELLKSFSAPSP